MIDAVAKALALWAVPYNDWDSMSEAQRDRWREGAKAALDPIRDPSAAMITAGAEWIYTDRGNDPREDAKSIWRDMFDAATTPADG